MHVTYGTYSMIEATKFAKSGIYGRSMLPASWNLVWENLLAKIFLSRWTFQESRNRGKNLFTETNHARSQKHALFQIVPLPTSLIVFSSTSWLLGKQFSMFIAFTCALKKFEERANTKVSVVHSIISDNKMKHSRMWTPYPGTPYHSYSPVFATARNFQQIAKF